MKAWHFHAFSWGLTVEQTHATNGNKEVYPGDSRKLNSTLPTFPRKSISILEVTFKGVTRTRAVLDLENIRILHTHATSHSVYIYIIYIYYILYIYYIYFIYIIHRHWIGGWHTTLYGSSFSLMKVPLFLTISRISYTLVESK